MVDGNTAFMASSFLQIIALPELRLLHLEVHFSSTFTTPRTHVHGVDLVDSWKQADCGRGSSGISEESALHMARIECFHHTAPSLLFLFL